MASLSKSSLYMVAPLVGAWIEISKNKGKYTSDSSLLSWERGLKFPCCQRGFYLFVAPLVGAWIEIMKQDC